MEPTITAGDAVVLDADRAVVVPGPRDRGAGGGAAVRRRGAVKRERLKRGELSYDIDGLRAIVDGESDAPASRS